MPLLLCFDGLQHDGVLHVELARAADILLIAPLSANTLAKLALGLCDNLVTLVARCWPVGVKPMLVAPAMNTNMWAHPVTRGHLETLEGWGVRVMPPVVKLLACGDTGVGAMSPVDVMVECVRQACSGSQCKEEAPDPNVA
jgi:phosphopantothenoylcysteine decarboxylase